MKKNKMMRIASVLLVAVLLSTCAIRGTFAKYASEFTADDNVRVAKWIVSANAKDSQTFAFNLFDTIKSTNGFSETNVVSGLIAPGTQGEFSIVLNADTEVAYDWEVDFEVINEKSVPIKFRFEDDNNWGNLGDLNGHVAADEEALAETITVYWMWDFGEEVDDDAQGYSDGTAQVEVGVKVTFTQVD